MEGVVAWPAGLGVEAGRPVEVVVEGPAGTGSQGKAVARALSSAAEKKREYMTRRRNGNNSFVLIPSDNERKEFDASSKRKGRREVPNEPLNIQRERGPSEELGSSNCPNRAKMNQRRSETSSPHNGGSGSTKFRVVTFTPDIGLWKHRHGSELPVEGQLGS